MSDGRHDIELFDAYLKEELNSSDRADFEVRLETDPGFEQAFTVHKILVMGIKDKGREELKSYLKTNGKMQFWGENYWPKKMRFAAAAVFILFAGIYAIIHVYVPQNKESLALKEENKPVLEPRADTLSQGLTLSEQNKGALYPSREGKYEKQTDADEVRDQQDFTPKEASPEELMDQVSEKETVEGRTLTGEDDYYKDYKVITEKKLKDTTFIALLVFNDAYTSTSKLAVTNRSADNKTESKKSNMIIPGVANNNVSPSNKVYNVTVNDTLMSAETAGAGVKKEKALEETNNTRSLKVEFWSSPVNFKGYNYVGNTVQIYSLNSWEVKLYIYNNQLYLRCNGMVYNLSPCTDACPFKKEGDEDISKLILKQN